MTRRFTIVLALALALASTVVGACGSSSGTALGPCDLSELGVSTGTTPATPVTTPSRAGAPVVEVVSRNGMSGNVPHVLLTVLDSGDVVAVGRSDPVSARLDRAAMDRLTTCLRDSGFAELADSYPDEHSAKAEDGRFCGIDDASTSTISTHGIVAPTKNVSGYALDTDLDPDGCDLGHPTALKQVYAALDQVRQQVAGD